MRSQSLLFPLAICACLTSACVEKKPVPAQVPPPPLTARGLPFSLPKTTLSVDLTVVKTSKKPGQFCQLVDLFLPDAGLNPPCGADSKPTAKTAVKAYSVSTMGVPDPAKTYLLPSAQKGGWAIDTSVAVEFTERGLLNSISDERTNRRVEVVVGILKAAAGIFARAIGDAEQVKMPDKNDKQRFRKKFLNDWQLVWNFDRLNENRADALVALWKAQDPALFAARAAYGDIADLGNTYKNLLGGAGAVSAATLIAEVRKETESRVNAFFLGTSEAATWSPTFEVDPGNDSGTIPLILIDDCGAKLAAGAKLIKNPLGSDVKCDTARAEVSLKLTKAAAISLDLGSIDACIDTASKVLKGIPFILPAEATVGLDGVTQFLPEQQIQVSQWGKTSCLTMPGNSYTAAVTYWGSTGAIKSVKFTDKSLLTKESVEALSGIAGDVQKAVLDASKKAAEDARNKDLNDLKAQRERLEERVKIQTACAALNIACEF